MGSRLAVAAAAAAAVIFSAPFAQQLFTDVSTRWPAQSRALGVAATAVPAGLVFLLALWRIRDRRLVRYALAALGFGLGTAYILLAELTFAESFHFAEYGLLAVLFYRVWRPPTDAQGDLIPEMTSVGTGVGPAEAGHYDRHGRVFEYLVSGFSRTRYRHNRAPEFSDVEGRSNDDWSILVLPLLAGTIVGSLDEWFQWFIPIRAGEARDVLLNTVATSCGVFVAVALDPPARVRLALDRRSRLAVLRWAAAALIVFGVFFHTVHVGHDVRDWEIGSFRSRYTAAELARAARDRAARWRDAPPIAQRRLWREDHYLTEALWHVQRRNQAWDAGDAATAWRENRILEKFYAPVLATPTYASPGGHRWPAAQRDDAAARVGGASRPFASETYAYPLYTWPTFF